MNLEIIKKTKEHFFKKSKLYIFLVIFSLICLIYNIDNQNLNYFLKRGVVLKYSISENDTIKEKNLTEKLSSLSINYSFIETTKQEKTAESNLYIGLAIRGKEKNKEIFNNISDYIFDNYKDSKLVAIKTLNNKYGTPFNSFLIFLGLLAISGIIWIIFLYLISDCKKLTNDIKQGIINFFKKRKEDITNLKNKTKEKGVGYLLKRILFDDEETAEKEQDVTKEIVTTIIFVLLCVVVIRYFIGELRWIPSGSMRPTILEHDRVFVEKLDFPKKEIKRGDILVFYPPEVELSNSPLAIISRLTGIFCKDIAYIKRVVGMPNDKFEIKQKENGEYSVYINNVALDEPYINSKTNWTPCNEQMHCGEFTIPEDHYFMMGDNRGNSQDSRFWGFLHENRVIGRANFMFWPISRINVLKDNYLELHKENNQGKVSKETYIINRY